MSTTNQEPATTSAGTSYTATVLCVDDEVNILNALRRVLRPSGYRILVAENGAKGLEQLEREKVDLVISDMRMPEMDGSNFLGQVAQRWPETVRILLTGYADLTSTISAINQGQIYRYIAKPWEDNDLRITVQRALELKNLELERNSLLTLTQKQNSELKELNASLESKVLARTEEVRQTMDMLDLAHKSLKEAYTAAIKTISNLIEVRAGGMAGHNRRVAEYAVQLGQKLGLDEAQQRDLHYAALLHDIGKMGLPDRLLNKPFYTLEESEQINVAKHPAVGQAMLMALGPLKDAAKIIRGHHELYDGQGYPDRLGGNEIPIGARILVVVNEYDALLNSGLFTKQYTPDEAREFLLQNSGRRYDPNVVKSFIGLLDEVRERRKNIGEQCLDAKSLKAGMVLARDLASPDGVLLLAKGYMLDEALVNKIQRFQGLIDHNLEIYVEVRRGA